MVSLSRQAICNDLIAPENVSYQKSLNIPDELNAMPDLCEGAGCDFWRR